jgi:hypothetical protein
MAALIATLSDLRRQASAAPAAGPEPQLLLDGSPDAVAGARLQETVQQIASQAGTNLIPWRRYRPSERGHGGGLARAWF